MAFYAKHNGYTWESLCVKTSIGCVLARWESGGYDVALRDADYEPPLPPAPASRSMWKSLKTQNIDCMYLHLFEEQPDDRATMTRVKEILAAAGVALSGMFITDEHGMGVPFIAARRDARKTPPLYSE
jgi:hypothetical protein